MAKDDSPTPRDPDGKRAGAAARARTEQRAAAWSQPKRGRSGYGMESIRPHLRAQIEQQKLLRPTFPPESADED